MAGSLLLNGTFLAGLGLGAGGLVAASLALASSRRGALPARLGELRRTYLNPAGGETKPTDRSIRSLPMRALESLTETIGSAWLLNGKQQEKMRLQLLHAGIRRSDGTMLLMVAKLVGAVGLALLAVPLAELSGMLPHHWIAPIAAAIAGALVGGMLPETLLDRRARARQAKITQRLPDALDLLIIFATAGYGVDMAIQRLSQELKRSAPELADELTVTSNELRMLSDRNQALLNLAERTGIPSARSLVSTLIQAQKYGTPLSQALRTLAIELRNDRVSQMEERAGRLPVLITLPMIALILPAVMIVVLTPGILQARHAWPSLGPDRSPPPPQGR